MIPHLRSNHHVVASLGLLLIASMMPANCPGAVPPSAMLVPAKSWPAESLEFVGGSTRESAARQLPGAPGMNDQAYITLHNGPNGMHVDIRFGVASFYGGRMTRPWSQAEFRYADLSKGQVVPMLGALYSVSDVSSNPSRVKLSKLTDQNMTKELGTRTDSIAIPVGDEVGFRFAEAGGADITVMVKVVAATLQKDNSAVARIREQRLGAPQYQAPRETNIVLGDSILMEGSRIKVVKIVPNDDKRHVVGWVEFSLEAPKNEAKPSNK